MPVNVTRTFVPPRAEYEARLAGVFESACLTNQGTLLAELESTLRSFLGVKRFQALANGTLALQAALRALDLTGGEIITTPFSYVATISSILWEHCTPVFVDIEPHNFTIDPIEVKKAVGPKTRAILPVHVFGYACDVDALKQIADDNDLKIIYDGAHAFGCRYRGRSLLDYGDISTCSFHATKLFHTGEGGGCIIRSQAVDQKLDLIKRFGHNEYEHLCLGANMKMSELHAAMGLTVFPHLSRIMADRKKICGLYDELLSGRFQRPATQENLEYNYAYYPILFNDENQLHRALAALAVHDIYPRRYFYPSLNTLPYLQQRTCCPVAENISSRIACLPLFIGLPEETIRLVCRILKELP